MVNTDRLLCVYTESTGCTELGCMTDGMSTACHALITPLLFKLHCHALAILKGHNVAVAICILLRMIALSTLTSHQDDKHSI